MGKFFIRCRIQLKFCLRVRLKRWNGRREFEFDRTKSKNNIAENSVALGYDTHNRPNMMMNNYIVQVLIKPRLLFSLFLKVCIVRFRDIILPEFIRIKPCSVMFNIKRTHIERFQNICPNFKLISHRNRYIRVWTTKISLVVTRKI